MPESDTTEALDKIVTVNNAAKRLGVPPSMLRNLVRYGTLRADPATNGTLVLRESEIQRFLELFGKMRQTELADPEDINASIHAGSSQSKMKRMDFTSPVERSPEPKQRCRCGKCGPCEDAARWERIFQEKFADPEYYTRRVPRQSSSLSSIS